MTEALSWVRVFLFLIVAGFAGIIVMVLAIAAFEKWKSRNRREKWKKRKRS